MHVAPLAASHDLEAIGAKRTCRDGMDARLERTIGENPITWHRLLRARRQWPRHRRAAEQRDEHAPLRCSHSITSSAMASSLSGIWRPSVLAVLRLMASSNFVGC